MAQRVYRHDLRCPHGGSNWLPKDGHSRGKQTSRCGDCHSRFTPDGNRHYYAERIKQQALRLYGAGSSLSAISRVLAIKLGTVSAWINKSPPGAGWTARWGIGGRRPCCGCIAGCQRRTGPSAMGARWRRGGPRTAMWGGRGGRRTGMRGYPRSCGGS